MKTILEITLFILVTIFPAIGFGEKLNSAYLCIANAATGFSEDQKGNWSSVNFKVKGDKYILKNNGGNWVWQNFGEDESVTNGEAMPFRKCGEFNEYGFIDCTFFSNLIRFNKLSLRYQIIDPIGYVVSKDLVNPERKWKGTPHIEIGSCTVI